MKTIVLIGCGKRKQPEACAAKDLYTGPLFRARRRYAEESGHPWFILSALHGLVEPEQRLEPYDFRMPPKSNEVYGRGWALRVCARLNDLGFTKDQFIELSIHASPDYWWSIHLVKPDTWLAAAPFIDLGIGKQLQWYRLHHELKHPPAVAV